MRRKAFWGDSGATMRQVPSVVNGEMVDFWINTFGVQFARRSDGKMYRLIPWAELHRLAQQNPNEAAPAADGEGLNVCLNCGAIQREHAIDRRSNQQVFLQRARPGKVLCVRTGCIIYRDKRASEPSQELGAAMAERSEPPCSDKIIRFGDRKFVRTGQRGSIAEGQWFIAEQCIDGQSKQIIPLTPIYAVTAWDGPRELLREITEEK